MVITHEGSTDMESFFFQSRKKALDLFRVGYLD